METQEKTIKIEIDPSVKQRELLCGYLSKLTQVWNFLVGKSREEDFKCTKGNLYSLIKGWKENKGWFGGLSQPINQLAREQFYEAYKEWVSGDRSRPQYKDQPIQSMKTTLCKSDGLERFLPGTYHEFTLGSKIGKIRSKEGVVIPPNILEVGSTSSSKYVRVKREKDGKWFACFVVNVPADETPTNLERHEWVGIDPGINALVTLSDGRQFHSSHLSTLADYKAKKARLQQDLSRKKEGSNNWQAAKDRLATYDKRVKRTRDDILHKLSRSVVEYVKGSGYKGIAWEGTSIKDMLEDEDFPAYLKDKMSSMAWNQLMRYVEYKAREEGLAFKQLDEVDKFASSKTCHICSEKHEVNHQGRWTDFECPHCGRQQARDVNAARNIRDAVHLVTSIDYEEGEWDRQTLRQEIHALRN